MVNHSSARPHIIKPTRNVNRNNSNENVNLNRSTENLNLNGASKKSLSNALKRRAQAVINDKSIDPQTRAVIRYGLETKDPWLAELIRRVDAGEAIFEQVTKPEPHESINGDSFTHLNGDSVTRFSGDSFKPFSSDSFEAIDSEPFNFESLNPNATDEKLEALTNLICRAGDEPAIKSAALLVLMATLESSTHSKSLANTAKHIAFARCAELNVCGIVESQIATLERELFVDHNVLS